LGEIIDVSSLTELIESLNDDQVRSRAAGALGEIIDVSSLTELIESLNDDNLKVRSEAAEALGNIGYTSARAGPRVTSSWNLSFADLRLLPLGNTATPWRSSDGRFKRDIHPIMSSPRWPLVLSICMDPVK